MLLRRLTDFVLQSRFQAMVAAFVFASSSLITLGTESAALAFVVLLISTLSIAIVGLVTLRKGMVEGAAVLLAASLPYLIGYVLHPDYYVLGLTLVSAILVWCSNVLTWVGAEVLRRTISWSITLQVLALVCIVSVCLAHIINADLPGWWGTQLGESFNKAIEASDVSEVAMQKKMIADTVARIKLYATASAAVFVWLNAVMQLLLARWWQAVIFNPGGLRKELYQIRMGHFAGLLFILGLLLSYWQDNPVLKDIMPIMYVLFGAAGLSLLHKFAASLKWGWIVLVIFYSVFPFTMMIAPMVGLLDVWLDFRERYK